MIRPVILSGGGGTRLWPLSRSGNPKQFHRLFGEQSLLQATVQRCLGPLFSPPLISTGEEQRFFVLDQLQVLGLTPAAILLEPVPRNTAPAIAAAAYWALARGEDEPLFIMPSDQLIRDIAALNEGIEAALPACLDGNILTFGIRPTGPSSGYGYIKAGPPAEPGSSVHKAEKFLEKPSGERAAELIAEGSYFWNSGMFLSKPSVLLAELHRYAPDVSDGVRSAMETATADDPFVRPNSRAFESVRSISLDYAVMEHSDKVFVVPAAFDWSDVGSWDAVHGISAADERGNVLVGDVLALDVSHSLIRSDAKITLAALGLDRMICVAADDAVFIAPLDRAQEVKRAVDELRARGHKRADDPARVYRPWGSYQIMDRGERFQTKRLIVKPGGKLSLQKHEHRSEHWVVVNGTAEVTVGSEVWLLQENESTFVPAGTPHRLANPGTSPLHLIEVQCGSYLGEDDIVRIEDEYGRA